MHRNKSFLPFAIAGGLAAMLALSAQAETAAGPDTVLATVDGVEITLGHMIIARQGLPAQLQALPDETLFDPLLEQLIEQTALMIAGEPNLGTRDRLQIENDRRSSISNAVLNNAAEGALTDENLATAYESFVAEFESADPVTEFNASHIIVETEDEAQALRDELDAGADFAELARQHSTDGAAAGGGSLGWFGPGAMIPEFENAVAAMDIGDVVGPLQTRFGWHLVTLNDTRTASTPAFEDIRDELSLSIRRETAEAAIANATEAVTIERINTELAPGLLGRTELLDE